jgi:2-polyprenyl-6-methoxyphenol hydroxylase-like FAD-dependent oxidoreductase
MNGAVLVVGAGPVGLTMGCELRRHGVACRVVDKLVVPTDKSKALGVHARTLECLTFAGIADRFVAAGNKMHGTNAYADGKRVVHVSFDEIVSPYPYVLLLAQNETERLLAERLAELGVAVERGTELTGFTQDDDGVTATLARAGGEAETARFAWVVGCDGAHSAVRKQLGLPFEGVPYEEAFALGDLRVDWSVPDDEIHAFLSAEGGIVCFPFGRDGRWRVIAECDAKDPTVEDFERLLRACGAPAAKLSEPRWLASFRIHRRIVPRYKTARAFLAGDAAHIHSPVGGQGMNTGMQDAINLAWKLGLVDAGAASPRILDSYEAERRPVAAQTLSGTDLATRAFTLRNPVAREIRDRVMTLLSGLEMVQRRVLTTASEIGVGYRSSPIVAERRAPVGRATVGKRVGEAPTVGDWLDFGGGPRAGDRVPDVTIADGAIASGAIADGASARGAAAPTPGAPRCLFHLLRHAKHTLLLFDGAAATPDGYRSLAAIARRAAERKAPGVEAWIVVPRAERPAELADGERVVLDPEGALHARFGAGAECLYLVRPDGYVGFRSQPADGEALEAYFTRLLS